MAKEGFVVQETPYIHEWNARKPWLVDFAYVSFKAYFAVTHRVELEHLERLRGLEERGFVLLPRHQSVLDILLECIVLKEGLNRHAFYLMKPTLPDALKYLGGAKVIRQKDCERLGVSPEEYEQRVRDVDEFTAYQLERDDIIITHIEGGRKNGNGRMKPWPLERLLKIQQRLGKEVPYVPLDVVYGDTPRYRPSIVVTVGNPLWVLPPTDTQLPEELARLVHHVKTEIPAFGPI